MTGYVALLRAVNVGGTGKLPMSVLKDLCETAGFRHVSTYIASGNVVFQSDQSEADVRAALEKLLHGYAGKEVGVMVRNAAEIAEVSGRNPFDNAPGNRVVALFIDGQVPQDPYNGVTGIDNEQIKAGKRELFIFYPEGMARTKLRIPGEKRGTARNMNTVSKLAAMSAKLV